MPYIISIADIPAWLKDRRLLNRREEYIYKRA